MHLGLLLSYLLYFLSSKTRALMPTLQLFFYFCPCRFMHIGQLFNGVGGPVSMGGPPVFSAVWFPVHQRTTATAIAASLNGLGVSIAYIIGKCYISFLCDRMSLCVQVFDLPEFQILETPVELSPILAKHSLLLFYQQTFQCSKIKTVIKNVIDLPIVYIIFFKFLNPMAVFLTI